MKRTNIRITGPTPLPPEVELAMIEPVISHRGEAFRIIFREALAGLQHVVGTRSIPMLFSGSGTAGLEAAIVNMTRPGDRVLATVCGQFGRRWRDIARAFGTDLEIVEVPDGTAIAPEQVSQALRRPGRPWEAVLITHNETSTGVANPLHDLVRAIRQESDAMVMVDGTSSVGAMACDMDLIGVDALVTASQKALMAPPGLAIVVASERAHARARANPAARYCFAFDRLVSASKEGTAAFTPCIPAIRGLSVSLLRILEEGLVNVIERTERAACACRDELRSAGLHLFADPFAASPTVTSFLVPSGLDASTVRAQLEVLHGTYVSQGRGDYKHRLLRIGHMGYFTQAEVIECARAIVTTIRDLSP